MRKPRAWWRRCSRWEIWDLGDGLEVNGPNISTGDIKYLKKFHKWLGQAIKYLEYKRRKR